MDSSSLLYGTQEKKSSAVQSLHSVRKPPSKPSKRPDPIPPRVYSVEPRGFRQLVQRLTGAPEPSQTRRLKDVAPPPLELLPQVMNPVPAQPPPVPVSKVSPTRQWVTTAGQSTGSASPCGFLSPTSYAAWSVFPLLSPGTMASLDRTVL
ncbi:hypothetical protein QJS04_geneDACA016015 [Acorus gramineus]|uniref:VQ domain-containing protein n=1 Tax=Acorus gramineus TaxID=55184 RepID=A0AAV9BJA7_ACOGR|nr:hypothetical protein QJS04_geneDACA016015 [Acorus gramineus]